MLLVGEPIAASRFSGGLLPEWFWSECSHRLAPLRSNGRALPGSARRHAGGLSARPVLFPGFRPGLLLPPLREAERRNGAGTTGHLCEGAPPALATGRRAFRRSTAAIFDTITVLLGRTGGLAPHVIQAAFAPPFIRRVQPLKAAPSSGADGDRASWDEVTNLACRRRHPRSADRTSPEDALSERGWEEYSPERSVRQAYKMLDRYFLKLTWLGGHRMAGAGSRAHAAARFASVLAFKSFAVLLVADLLQPVDILAVERFP